MNIKSLYVIALIGNFDSGRTTGRDLITEEVFTKKNAATYVKEHGGEAISLREWSENSYNDGYVEAY